jgi:beta-glucosidase
MKMKLIKMLLLLFVAVFAVAQKPAASNEEKFVSELLKRMTLDEKLGQLTQPIYVSGTKFDSLILKIKQSKVGSLCVVNNGALTVNQRNQLQRAAVENSRLGIPVLFGFDVIHGYKTIFPTPLGMSASWDEEMVVEASGIAAREARSAGFDMTFSPMVDVSRDPRWGRISECYGEDVLLNARLGAAAVRGYQGKDLTDHANIGSCVKHFVAYGLSQGGRDKQFTEVSQRSLLETYLPPFEACVKAGAISVMTGFNDVSGVPATANHYTLTEILKQKWGFDGFTLSDWDAVIELMNHGIAGTTREAAEKAINAGTDMEMKSNTYISNLTKSVQEGTVKIKTIDDAVTRILRMKYRLGLFARPYTDDNAHKKLFLNPAHRIVARRAAAESMVLLKNNGILPLKDNVKRISVTGPFATNRDMLGWWIGSGEQSDVVTVVDGLTNNAPKGVEIVNGTDPRNKTGISVVCIGEPGNTFGESHSFTDITLTASQVELIRETKKRGNQVIAVVFNGRPLVLTPIMDYVDALVIAWHPGTEAGNAVADVLFGKVNPSGKLTTSFLKTSGQIPLYYADRVSGRPEEDIYLDNDGKALFPFGFGLSYTNYAYSNLKLSANSIKQNGQIEVSVDVKNTGNADGKEIVQLYVQDLVASVTRPQKELKDFQKVFIPKGETKTVKFTLSANQLAFYNQQLNKVVEPGEFKLWVAPDSQSGLSTVFTIK